MAIVNVIAMEPKVLILDEPTAEPLDPVGVESILGNIRDYHQAQRHHHPGLPTPWRRWPGQ